MAPRKKSAKNGQPEEVNPPVEYYGVVNECIELSLRECSQWAIEKAGETKRTGNKLESCPNDTAFYLYLEALERPKEFFAKFAQIESKAQDENTFRRECAMSVKELEDMLDEIIIMDMKPDTSLVG